MSKIIRLWSSTFGAANTFLMSNGGEFVNDEMQELSNQYGINTGGEFVNDEMRELRNQYSINIKHTAAYSPWWNGLNIIMSPLIL